MSKTNICLDPTSEPRFGVRLCVLLLLAYTCWRMTHTPSLAGPPILEIQTEKQLEETLLSGNFSVIGVYNSNHCPKCLTYFLKWSHNLVDSPLAAHFNLSLHLIDQYSFRNARNTFEEPLYTSPSLFFFSGSDLLFFANFTMEANQQTFWGSTFRRLDAATAEFWNSTLPKLIKIDSMAQLLDELETQKLLVLYMGPQGSIFRKFVDVATHNCQRAFAFVTDPDLMATIAIYYQGYLPQKPIYIAVLRHESLVTRVDTSPFVIIEPFMDEMDLDRLIRLECLPRVARNRDSGLFIQHLKDRLPVFAYVEAAEPDPYREEKQLALIEFLLPRKKLAHTSIISADSPLSDNALFRMMFPGGNQDALFAVLNVGAGAHLHLKMFPFRGDFTESNLLNFYHTHITTRMVMSPGMGKLYQPLERDVVHMYKNVILGRMLKNIRAASNGE